MVVLHSIVSWEHGFDRWQNRCHDGKFGSIHSRPLVDNQTGLVDSYTGLVDSYTGLVDSYTGLVDDHTVGPDHAEQRGSPSPDLRRA